MEIPAVEDSMTGRNIGFAAYMRYVLEHPELYEKKEIKFAKGFLEHPELYEQVASHTDEVKGKLSLTWQRKEPL